MRSRRPSPRDAAAAVLAGSAPPLFILSAPRSGSTLLRYILDTHSQIASPGEIGLGSLCARLGSTVDLTVGEATAPAGGATRRDLVNAEVRTIVERLMGSYLAQKGKRIWCEKSIDNLRHLETLDATFPAARYVCLYRDSLDFIQSCLDYSRVGFMLELHDYVARQPGNLVAAMTSAWIDATTRLLDWERRHPRRCFRIRYEDLVTAPDGSLRRLFAFAGVAWEEELLGAVFTARHDRGGGDMKILLADRIDAASVGQGARVNIDMIPAAARAEADRLSRRLSYPPIAPGRRLPWAAAGEPQPTDAAVASAFEHFAVTYLEQRLRTRAEKAAAIRGSCRLSLHGRAAASWKLDFSGGVPAILADAGSADCSLAVGAADFVDLVTGRLDPTTALVERRVRAEGDLELAERVGKLIYH
jgi:protein-tyrosine sulfotransferase